MWFEVYERQTYLPLFAFTHFFQTFTYTVWRLETPTEETFILKEMCTVTYTRLSLWRLCTSNRKSEHLYKYSDRIKLFTSKSVLLSSIMFHEQARQFQIVFSYILRQIEWQFHIINHVNIFSKFRKNFDTYHIWHLWS